MLMLLKKKKKFDVDVCDIISDMLMQLPITRPRLVRGMRIPLGK